ncbi:MAG: hypothetical protein II336_19250 [Loktanella sp.]|nr:hypothetical protein [Loktanella sp.]
MMLVEQTPIQDLVLPLAQLKQYLRLASGFADAADQDGLLLRHLRAAMAQIEARTGKILIRRDFNWTVTHWRDPVRQILPVTPVSAILHVTRITADGRETAANADHWYLLQDSQRPGLVAKAGLLPRIPPHGAIRIGLRAGFAPDWADLPADLAEASLMLAAHHYDSRHDFSVGGYAVIPAAVLALVAPHRPLRLGARR